MQMMASAACAAGWSRRFFTIGGQQSDEELLHPFGIVPSAVPMPDEPLADIEILQPKRPHTVKQNPSCPFAGWPTLMPQLHTV